MDEITILQADVLRVLASPRRLEILHRLTAVQRKSGASRRSWADTLRQAKGLGGIDIQACSLSMDLLGIAESDLDPIVDGVEGVTSFYLNAGAGQVVFI